jgi:hypothetical protein
MHATIENFVGIYEDAFTPEFCQDAITRFDRLAENGLAKSRQELNDAGKATKDDIAIWTGGLYQEGEPDAEADMVNMSTKIGIEFNEVYWGKCYPHYAEHFDPLKTSATHAVYANKVQRTKVGQGYHVWHYESSSREASNRLLTHIVYLNDVEEGGETELLYFNKRIKPKAGTLIIFPAAFTHTHRGNPPLSNDKYIITGWTEF